MPTYPQSDAGGESTLDIQTIMGVAPRNQHFFWSVSGTGPAKPPGQGAYILEWAMQVQSDIRRFRRSSSSSSSSSSLMLVSSAPCPVHL